MAQQNQKSTSHLGFFVAILAIAVVSWGAWRVVGNNYFTTQQQVQTAAENPGMPHKPKDKEGKPGESAGETPSAAVGESK